MIMTAPKATLPVSYNVAVIELEGRFYPVRIKRDKDTRTIKLDSAPHLLWDIEVLFGIPPAQGPFHRQGVVSFSKHHHALAFCHRNQEEFGVLWHWQEVAARTEAYPERNAWYREEIRELAKAFPHVHVSGTEAYAHVSFRDGTWCSVFAPNVDEMWKQLYERVYETLHTKATEAGPASPATV